MIEGPVAWVWTYPVFLCFSLCGVWCNTHWSWVSRNYSRHTLAQANDRSVACLAFVCLEYYPPQSDIFPAGSACWPLAVSLGLEGRPVRVLHQAPCQLESRLLNPQSSPSLRTSTAKLAASLGNTHVCLHLQGQQHPVATCLPESHLAPNAEPTPKAKRLSLLVDPPQGFTKNLCLEIIVGGIYARNVFIHINVLKLYINKIIIIIMFCPHNQNLFTFLMCFLFFMIV